MNFEEFESLNFGGNEDEALECLANEVHECEFKVTGSGTEWRAVMDSLNKSQKEKFDYIREKLKWKITSEKIVSSTKEYKLMRNVFSVCVAVAVLLWFGLLKISGQYNVIVFLVTSLIAVGAFALWVYKGNKRINALKNGEFYIDVAVCSGMSQKTSSVDWSDVDEYEVRFRGYKPKKLKKYEYDNIKYDVEYFIVVINGSDKIHKIYSSQNYELSEEFYLNDGKYYLKR